METNDFNAYKEAKAKYPEAIILCRCGQFYLMYGKDAIEAIHILKLAPSQDSNGEYIAGFPHGELDTYLPKLVRAGKRVAIIDYKTA